MTVSYGRERNELLSGRDGRHPVVAPRRLVLPHRCREVPIHEVSDGDRDQGVASTALNGPIDGGAAGRAEVVARRLVRTCCAADAINFESVVDLRFPLDRDTLILGE